MSVPTKRACDACHRRKVRCNSQQPCGNCSQAGLSCTYDAIPQKKGPKGSRAKVISELRETQKQSNPSQNHSLQNGHRSLGNTPESPSYAPTPRLLVPDLVDSCAEFFFVHMYPTMPILHREQLRQIIRDANTSLEAYCLISSLSAFMLIQPGVASKVPNVLEEASDSVTNPRMGNALMEEAIRVRKGFDYIENPTVLSVMTSLFLFGCCFGLNKQNTGSHHLREATGLAHSLGMQDEQTYVYGDTLENGRRRRLFWLLFVTERAYALQKHLPLTLHATISLPTVDQDSSNSIAGFIHLVNLYRPFDDTFIGLWNKSRTDCSTYYLAHLQQQVSEALPGYLNTTESQAADLRTSQQWLRTVVWQLSIANGYLSSSSPTASMTFRYPIEIARDLVSVTRQFTKKAMEIHGIGLIEKIFDVACCLVDVMSCVPPSSANPLTPPTPQDSLNELLLLISELRGGESRYLPLIMTKIRDTFPSIAPAIPPSLVQKAALYGGPSLTSGTSEAPVMGVSIAPTVAPIVNTMAGSQINGLPPTSNSGGVRIKLENTGSGSSTQSSPHNTPPYLHFYPLA